MTTNYSNILGASSYDIHLSTTTRTYTTKVYHFSMFSSFSNIIGALFMIIDNCSIIGKQKK